MHYTITLSNPDHNTYVRFYYVLSLAISTGQNIVSLQPSFLSVAPTFALQHESTILLMYDAY